MEITWYGHSCFRITERGRATVVTDPFGEHLGYEVPRLKTDIAAISHRAPGHAALDTLREVQYVIDGPGEYEIGGVFVIGVATYNPDTPDPRQNVVYVFDFDSLTVAHLGDLDHVPPQSLIDQLGHVNVALVPVGGGGSLSSGQAAEVVSLLEPAIVIPMHFQTPHLAGAQLDTVDRFLKEMGVSSIETVPFLRLSAGGLPEQTQVVVLDYEH
ncbi:MAG: MBL fold metallo-hydrolase [Anaerolineae bacterium]|nr:MBL fold metallo-hydrolase [Anaerolineae bacterium]